MFYEFRQYTVVDDKRDEWVKFFEKEILPFQQSKGMVVVGVFTDEEHPELFYWVRRFKNEKERVKLYKAVYESKEWTEYFSPRVAEFLDRKKIVVKRIIGTSKSVLL